jgi:hypothetical protein
MARPSLTVERLLALFAAGWLMLNYPLLALFGRLGTVAGIPALYLYLFVAWALLIAGIALVAGRGDGDGDGQ